MEVPTIASLRLCFAAALSTCCVREINDAKVATSTRPCALVKTSSSAPSMMASEGVRPGCSALVESENNASTPRSPNSASLPRSMGHPSTGVGSSLKSPVCTTNPTGVVIANPTASGMLCEVWKNSTSNGPRLIFSPACTVWIVSLSSRRASRSLFSSSPRVIAVA